MFSSADEAELFVNGKSQGRIVRAKFTYRFRWDKVIYAPGELHVVTYKNGQIWAKATVETTGRDTEVRLTADRSLIRADNDDLVFVKAEVVDSRGRVVADATNEIAFNVSGAGELVATDNGDPADLNAFPSSQRKAFSGLALAFIRANNGEKGRITITASGANLKTSRLTVVAV